MYVILEGDFKYKKSLNEIVVLGLGKEKSTFGGGCMKRRIIVITCIMVLLLGLGGLAYKTITHIRWYERIIINTNEIVNRIGQYTDDVCNRKNKNRGSIKTISVDEDVYVDSDTVVAVVGLEEKNTIVVVRREPDESSLAVANEAFVDFSKGEMGFYMAAVPQDADREVCKRASIDFEIIEKHQYTIKFVKEDGFHLKLVLTDDFTGESAQIEGDTSVAGCGWGKRKIDCIRGDVSIIDFYNLSTQSYDSKVLILGDSFIEGNSLEGERGKRYAKLIKDELGGNAFINGQGGASSGDGITWLKSYLMDVVQPQYAIVAFGMNERNFDTWKSNTLQIIDILNNNNVTPILVTITPSDAEVANDVHMLMNDFIRESGYMYIDAAKACSLDCDGLTFDESLFMADKIHPTVYAHRLIFEQAKKDIPDIFK